MIFWETGKIIKYLKKIVKDYIAFDLNKNELNTKKVL